MATLAAKALSADVTPRDRAWPVLIVSGTFGFLFGLTAFPELQSAVETAQVLAGVVAYPSSTPAVTFHTSVWSLLYQALALLLTLGLSELQLSVLLGGLLGMVSLQALAMIVYALSGDTVLAFVASVAIAISRTAEFGTAPPISLLGGPHAEAGIGLALAVLALGVVGSGWFRTGGFLFGAIPGVHLATGLWMCLVFLIVLGWEFRTEPTRRTALVRGFLLGGSVTILSLLVQVWLAGIPFVSMSVGEPYLTRFVESWDIYRQPVSVFADGVYLNAVVLVLATVWLTALKTDLAPASRILFKLVLVTAVVAVGLALLTWLSPARLPATILTLIPGLLLNVNAMLCVALVVGLIGVYRATKWGAFLGVLTLLGLLASSRSLAWDWLAGSARPGWATSLDPWFVLQGATVLLIGLALRMWNTERSDSAPGRWVRACRLANGVILVALVAGWWRASESRPGIADWTSDPLYRVASEGRGLLLPGASLRWIQLRTRRPLLMDGDLSLLPYGLNQAADAAEVMKQVYGVDFFNPPEEARYTTSLPYLHNKMIWEGYSREDWQQIRRAFHVVDVLTSAEWTLNLPVAAQSRELRLHHIPE